MVREIHAGGRVRPFLFSYKAIKAVTKAGAKGIDSAEVAGYWGFYFGAIRQGEKVDFDEAQIEEWFEEDLHLLKQVNEIVEEVMLVFEGEEGGKKKALKANK